MYGELPAFNQLAAAFANLGSHSTTWTKASRLSAFLSNTTTLPSLLTTAPLSLNSGSNLPKRLERAARFAESRCRFHALRSTALCAPKADDSCWSPPANRWKASDKPMRRAHCVSHVRFCAFHLPSGHGAALRKAAPAPSSMFVQRPEVLRAEHRLQSPREPRRSTPAPTGPSGAQHQGAWRSACGHRAPCLSAMVSRSQGGDGEQEAKTTKPRCTGP